MKQLENANEIIQNLQTSKLVLSDVCLQPYERTAYRFMGKFENGSCFDLVLWDRAEIQQLKSELQIRINIQYAGFSQFKVFADLKQDHKYTLVIGSELGMGVNAIQFQHHSVRFGKYAQYLDSVEVIFRPKRKRNLRGIRLYGNSGHKKEFILWDGWVEPNTNWMGQEEPGSTPFVTVQKSKYRSFDPQYFTDAMKFISQAPIAHNLEGESHE